MTAPMTPGLANLAAALAKVQAELPKLDRDRTVTVEPKDPKKPPYSYSYVTLANLSEAILPLLAKHGLSFVAMPGAGSDGKMCVRYQLMHDSGEALTGEFPISGEGGIQMIGGRITYARRYCLAAIVGVAADEDDESRLSDDGTRATAQRARQTRQAAPADNRPTAQRARAAAGGQPPLPGEPEPASTAQLQKLVIQFDEMGVSRDERLRLCSSLVRRELGSARELTKVEAHRVIDLVEKAKGEPEPFGFLAGHADGGEE